MFGSKMSFECLCLCYLLDGWGLKDALIQNGDFILYQGWLKVTCHNMTPPPGYQTEYDDLYRCRPTML